MVKKQGDLQEELDGRTSELRAAQRDFTAIEAKLKDVMRERDEARE